MALPEKALAAKPDWIWVHSLGQVVEEENRLLWVVFWSSDASAMSPTPTK